MEMVSQSEAQIPGEQGSQADTIGGTHQRPDSVGRAPGRQGCVTRRPIHSRYGEKDETRPAQEAAGRPGKPPGGHNQERRDE